MIRVYATGVFDLFHAGHLEFLKSAKSLGNYLIVGVHNDNDVASYKRIPIMPFEERIEIIKNIAYVDEAFDPPLYEDEKFYCDHNIDIHC